jgi:hypothetical protein
LYKVWLKYGFFLRFVSVRFLAVGVECPLPVAKEINWGFEVVVLAR